MLSKHGTGGQKMTGADIFTLIMLVATAFFAAFVLLIAAPGVIELIADAIVDIRYSVDKLKDALRGGKDGK
jgi:hypothetical protein